MTRFVIGPDVAVRLAQEHVDVALTQLQADAFITLDGRLARAAKDLVTIAPVEALT